MAATQYYATGRRKESTARVFLRPGNGAIKINHREFNEYFPIETLRILVMTPRPGCIMDDVQVKIPRPRALEAMNFPEFAPYVHRIRARFSAKGVIDA